MQTPHAKPVRSRTINPEIEEVKQLHNDIHDYFEILEDVFEDFRQEEGELPLAAVNFLNDYKAYLSSPLAYPRAITGVPSQLDLWLSSPPPPRRSFSAPAAFHTNFEKLSTFPSVPVPLKVDNVRVSACFDVDVSSSLIGLLQKNLNAMKPVDPSTTSETNKRKSISDFFDFFNLAVFTSTPPTSLPAVQETNPSKNTTSTTLPATQETNKRNSIWNIFNPASYITSTTQPINIITNTSASTPVMPETESTQKDTNKASTLDAPEIEPAQKPSTPDAPEIESNNQNDINKPSIPDVPEIESTPKDTSIPDAPEIEKHAIETLVSDVLEIESTQKDTNKAPTPDAQEIEPTQKQILASDVPEIEPTQKDTNKAPTTDVPAIEPAEKDANKASVPDVPAIEPAEKDTIKAPYAQNKENSLFSYLKAGLTGQQIEGVKRTKGNIVSRFGLRVASMRVNFL